MKKTLLLTLILVLLAPAASVAKVELDRFWQEFGITNILVTYTNESDKTFKDRVTIKCVTFNSSGGKVDVDEGIFRARNFGPISPGFSDTLKIQIIDSKGIVIDDVKCKAIEK